jgi:hypothetical protein
VILPACLVVFWPIVGTKYMEICWGDGFILLLKLGHTCENCADEDRLSEIKRIET